MGETSLDQNVISVYIYIFFLLSERKYSKGQKATNIISVYIL